MSAQRFWSKVIKTAECWLWQGAKSARGYGNFTLAGKTVYAHRFVMRGRLRKGLVVDHTCRNRLCVNPAHLRLVTYQTNTRENNDSPASINARKTECVNGHAFDQTNTRYGTNANGKPNRKCRACDRIRKKKAK